MGFGLVGLGLISGKGKIDLFFVASRPVLRLTQPPSQWFYGDFFPEIKRPEHEVDGLPPLSSKVKNSKGIRHWFPVCLHGTVLN
jgi:hypothetical protein